MKELCPCGSEKDYTSCCLVIHKDQSIAKNPVEIMRARYAAFVKKNISFLVNTIDPQVREVHDEFNYSNWANNAEFTKLIIISEAVDNNKGTVEFEAYFHEDGKDQVLHELSRFRKQAGCWYYRDGKVKIYENTGSAHPRKT